MLNIGVEKFLKIKFFSYLGSWGNAKLLKMVLKGEKECANFEIGLKNLC